MFQKRVLSIQSHVVSGYVGNKSATFPLQLLGYEVDPINSVQFSNHTGYKHGFKGDVLNSSQLLDLFQGLIDNDLTTYTHLLTGYVGDSSFLHSICTIYKKLKELNPNLIYVCDPVLGDKGVLYVPSDLVSIYKEQILPLTNLLTPNQFEAELLTDMKINNEQDIWIMMQKLHSYNIETVVLSSCDIGPPDVLIAYASKSNGVTNIKIKVVMKKYDAHFVGTGDLFCALFLAWNDLFKEDLKMVCDKVVSTMQIILQRTIKYASNYMSLDNNAAKYLELQLVASKKDIENPPNIVSSQYIEF